MDRKPTDITRKVLVLGSKGVGKTTFITKLLYNYTPTRYIPTKDDKRYKLTYHFPPPSIQLEFIESRHALFTTNVSFVVFIYDPAMPRSWDKAQQLYHEMRTRSYEVFKPFIVSSSDLYGENIDIDCPVYTMDNFREWLKEGLAFAKENREWQNREPLLALRAYIRGRNFV